MTNLEGRVILRRRAMDPPSGVRTDVQILSAVACVQEGHARTDAEIREYMSGNLCRCAVYPNIVEAVKKAKVTMRAASKD